MGGSRRARDRFEWERTLRDDEGVPWPPKAFMVVLGTWMDADGSNCKPSAGRISRTIGLGRSRVFELFGEAEATGYLASWASPGKPTLRVPMIPLSTADPSTPPDPSTTADGLPAVTRPPQRTGESTPPDGRGPLHRTQPRHYQVTTNPPPRAPAPDSLGELAEAAGASEEEIRALIATVRTERPDIAAPLRWLARCHTAGDLAPMLTQLRAAAAAEHRREWATWCDTQPPCPHGVAGGDAPHPDTGTPRCAICRCNTRHYQQGVHNGR